MISNLRDTSPLRIDNLPSTLNTKRENEQGYLSADFISS